MPPHTTPEKVMLLHLREFSSAEKCKEYTKILPYQSPTYTNSPLLQRGVGAGVTHAGWHNTPWERNP